VGRLARVIAYMTRNRRGVTAGEVTADTGGGAHVTGHHALAPGDDSPPMARDYVVLIPLPTTGAHVAVGYVDPDNAPEAGPGERRLYARGASGAPVVSLWLKADGSVTISNAAGGIVLGADGTVAINGAEISPAGAISADSIVADGKELAGHVHPAGDPPGTTGGNL